MNIAVTIVPKEANMLRKDLSTVPEEFRNLVANLISINDEFSRKYLSQILTLKKYIKNHPTKIFVFKCMDGRILFSAFTETPLGFLRNFRNLGGQFNFGWKMLRDVFSRLVHKAYLEGDGSIAIITYHFSKGSKSRGCAAYNYSKEDAIKGAFAFKRQVDRAYKGLPECLETIVVGIETDEDALIFHDDKETPLHLADVSPYISDEELFEHLKRLYPLMSIQMLVDLLPLLVNNVKHIARIRETSRPIIEMEHNEWLVGVGGATAFDFLHIPNTALLVGQYNPNLEKPIKKAFEVYKAHWQPGKKFLQLTAASYGGEVPRSFALEDVKYYGRLTREIAHAHCPELVSDMYQVRGILDLETQKLEILP